MKMGQRMGAGRGVWGLRPARDPNPGFDFPSEPPVGSQVVPAHNNVQPPASSVGRLFDGELCTVHHRPGPVHDPGRFMDGCRRGSLWRDGRHFRLPSMLRSPSWVTNRGPPTPPPTRPAAAPPAEPLTIPAGQSRGVECIVAAATCVRNRGHSPSPETAVRGHITSLPVLLGPLGLDRYEIPFRRPPAGGCH
jgi:hypothetical protein